jgi:hypothetical protein
VGTASGRDDRPRLQDPDGPTITVSGEQWLVFLADAVCGSTGYVEPVVVCCEVGEQVFGFSGLPCRGGSGRRRHSLAM